MRLIIMFVIGLLLIEAGLMGNPGSMIGSLIDPSQMQATGATSTPALAPAPAGPPLGGL